MEQEQVRLYCGEPMCDPDGTEVGSCGHFLPGRTLAEAAKLAPVFGWQLDPEPRCPGHHLAEYLTAGSEGL